MPDTKHEQSTETATANGAGDQKQRVAPEPKADVSIPPMAIDPIGIQNFPQQPLDPAFITVERIGGWIFVVVVFVFGVVGLVVVGLSLGLAHFAFWSSLIGFALIMSFLVWVAHALPKLQYEHARWRLTSCGLEIHRGVWWRSQISVPLARVQHTDVLQGPLLRHYGLAKLIVHTAGTENSSVELAGLSFATARRLCDALIENRGEIDGV